MAQPTKIVLNRQSDLILDNAQITNPQGIVLTDISGVSEAVASINEATSIGLSTEASIRVSDVSIEVDARVSGDLSLANDLSSEIVNRGTAIDAEASYRTSADLSLQNQIDFITSNVDDAAIDSLTEIVKAFQSADGDLNGAITTLANAAGSGLSIEIDARTSKDESLEIKFDGKHSTQQGYIEDAIYNEMSVRVSKDESLEIKFDGKHSTQQGYIEDAIYTEMSNRGIAIDAEASYRVSADLSLQNQIDFITSNVDAVAIDSLTEIVKAFQSADGDINNAITTLANAAGSGLSIEIDARTSADLSIANDLSSEIVNRGTAIDAEASYRTSADLSLANDLSSSISISVSDRISADESLSIIISSEIDALALTDEQTIELNTADNTIRMKETVAAPASGIRTFMGEVDIETVLKVTGVDVMATLSSEIVNRGTAIDAEASYRTSADLSLANDLSSSISISVSDRISADESLSIIISSEIDALALTDEQTIELNTADNTIRMKETVAAPASGIRTFMGEVDIETVLKVAGVDVMATLSSEVSRAESAEVSIALDFANIYAKHVNLDGNPDGSTLTFTLVNFVRPGSELIYLNGLLLEDADYTANVNNGKVESVTFSIAPSAGDKVRAYGVY